MPTATITPEGLAPPLRRDERLVCGRCRAEWDAATVPDEDVAMLYIDYGHAVCPDCRAFNSLYRASVASSVGERWPVGVTEHGWTAVVDLLILHLPALGLDPDDFVLMCLFERYRRTSGGTVYPKNETIARQAGMHERTVRRRVNAWVARGLWEKTVERRADGTRKTNRLTRLGLNRALAHIADNASSGRAPKDGLGALLDALKRPAASQPGTVARLAERGEQPGTRDQTTGHAWPVQPGAGARYQAEEVEAEEVEAELSFGEADPSDRLADDAEEMLSEDELVERLKREFGAREITDESEAA